MSDHRGDDDEWTPAGPPEPPTEHEILAATPETRAGRERLVWTALVVGVGLLVFVLMVASSFLPNRPELQVVTAQDVLSGRPPADRFGHNEIRISGWYLALAAPNCAGDSGGADASVAWLQRACPVRTLLADQPARGVTQAEVEGRGIRLAAPSGDAFPPLTQPGEGTAGMEELVFVGHFDDPRAASCVPDRVQLCRNTFVASDYDPLIH